MALEFFLEIYGLYDGLVSNTLLQTVLPYISLDILVQRYIAKRDKGFGNSSDSNGEVPRSPKQSSEDGDSISSPQIPEHSPDAASDSLSFHLRKRWKSGLAWLGLEEG